MPTFRVYLRRPTTAEPVWDWAETVVAANADLALGWAYSDWQRSNPTPPVPALSACPHQVRQQGAAMLHASAVSPAQQAFIDEMQKQVADKLSTQLDGAFKVVSYPSGFNYGITYGNNAYFNAATLGDIDSLLGVSSNGSLELTGEGFSNLYAQIMRGVSFSFSQQDQAVMNRQDTAADAQVTAILTEFTNAGGHFSDPPPEFGGKLQDVVDQLTKRFGSVENLPDTLNALRNAIATWKVMAADSYVLHNRWYAAKARIDAALANTLAPKASNGGMQVDDQNYRVGYTPGKLPSANQLIGSLNTPGRKIEIHIALDSFSSEETKLSISGGVNVHVPIANVLDLKVSAQGSYDLSRYTSSSSTVTMDMVYPGLTLFPATPSALSADNRTGWYAADILHEVVAKTGHDATGYQLQGSEFDVNELFGVGKVFSRLKTFVISQQPTITMTFTAVDTSRVTSDLKVGASVELSLFKWFKMGSVAGSYSVKDVNTSSTSGTVTVTFAPPQVSGTIPLQQQVAYVLGGVASYPPDHV